MAIVATICSWSGLRFQTSCFYWMIQKELFHQVLRICLSTNNERVISRLLFIWFCQLNTYYDDYMNLFKNLKCNVFYASHCENNKFIISKCFVFYCQPVIRRLLHLQLWFLWHVARELYGYLRVQHARAGVQLSKIVWIPLYCKLRLVAFRLTWQNISKAASSQLQLMNDGHLYMAKVIYYKSNTKPLFSFIFHLFISFTFIAIKYFLFGIHVVNQKCILLFAAHFLSSNIPLTQNVELQSTLGHSSFPYIAHLLIKLQLFVMPWRLLEYERGCLTISVYRCAGPTKFIDHVIV